MSVTAEQKQAHELGVVALQAHFQRGSLSVTDYVLAMLAYARAVMPEVQAFVHHDADIVALQTERLTSLSSAGAPLPALFGVPIALVDTIDTCDYPTEWGYAPALGRTPSVDAYLVHKLRQAGAMIWAKARTTALGTVECAATPNPRAPGCSSGTAAGGAAAAVASGLVPAAIAVQTHCEVIQSASFCGIYGFKPSRGLVFNGGTLKCAPSLDQVGVLARSVEDMAAVAEVIVGGHQLATGQLIFPTHIQRICEQEPPLPPKFMFVKTPWWDQMEAAAKEAFEALADELKDCMVEVELPASVTHALAWHQTLLEAEMATHLQPLTNDQDGAVNACLRAIFDRGNQVRAKDYLQAQERLQVAADGFAEYFEHFDAILTPASLGAAPQDGTGDPVMSTLWNFAGLPCLSMPLLQTETGMPLGVQLVAGMRNDARLLRTARWLKNRLG